MAFEEFLEQFQCRLAVTYFGHNRVKHPALTIDGPPKVVGLTPIFTNILSRCHFQQLDQSA